MKKVFLFVTAAIAAVTMFSCNKEIDLPQQGISDPNCPEGYYVEELTAVYPHDPATRTAFNETTGRFAWTEGDELAFHLSNGEYVAAPIDPATGKVKLYLPVGVTRDNYAVYPASSIVDEAAEIGNMKVTLPNSYDISADPMTDYVPTPLVAWNDAENNHLKFEHVGGLLQVNLTVPVGVKTATLNMGKVITGTFSLEDGTGNGIITPGEASAEDGITFVISESGLTEETQVKLLAPLPSGTYEHFEVSYDNGFEFSRDLSANPWTFNRSGGKKVTIGEENFEDNREFDYFWIQALEAGSTVKFYPYTGGSVPVKMYYQINDNKNDGFTEWTKDENSGSYYTTITLENEGDIVYFYGDNTKLVSSTSLGSVSGSSFSGTGRVKIGGTINTLYSRDEHRIPSTGAFAGLFRGNQSIVDASELNMECYYRSNIDEPSDQAWGSVCYAMFQRCSSLVAPPVLPWTSVGSGSFYAMFEGCTSLKEPAEWHVTNTPSSSSFYAMYKGSGITYTPEFYFDRATGTQCMFEMFEQCKSLTTITNFPFVAAGLRSCESMFAYCSALTETPEIITTSIGQGSFACLFQYCTNLKKTTSILPATKLAADCYNNMYANTALEEAPVLPATVMQPGCYVWMFLDTNISEVPELPATTLARKCYDGMFMKCDNLKTVPTDLLPATTLYEECYQRMFEYCAYLTNVPDLPATVMKSKCYFEMFSGCTRLPSVPENLLPSTQLAENCYEAMFAACKALTNGPALPATSIPAYAYSKMFSNCSKLYTAPALPATELSNSCYNWMFYNSGVRTMPELPATTLAPSCYYYMFNGCTGLNGHVVLPATTLATSCYGYMFNGCKLLDAVTIAAEDINVTSCLSTTFNGCSTLNEIHVNFSEWPTSSTNSSWVKGVPATIKVNGEDVPGRFYCPAALPHTEEYFNASSSASTGLIPYGWTVYAAQEVGAGL